MEQPEGDGGGALERWRLEQQGDIDNMPAEAAEDWEQAEEEVDPSQIPQPEWPPECTEKDLDICRKYWAQQIIELAREERYVEQPDQFEQDLQNLIEDMNGDKTMGMSPYVVWMRGLTELSDVDETSRLQNFELKVWLLEFHDRFVAQRDDQQQEPEWVAQMLCLYHDKPGELRAYLKENFPTGLDGRRLMDLDLTMLRTREGQMNEDKGYRPESPPAAERAGEGSSGSGGSSEHREATVPEEPRALGDLRQGSFAGGLFGGLVRSQWLQENARIAHQVLRIKGRSGFRRFFQEAGVSPGFRIYFFGWLSCALAMSVILGMHFATVLLSRMFVPVVHGWLPSAGLLACFLLYIHFIGSFLTCVVRVMEQWAHMDDVLYFADFNWGSKLPQEDSDRDRSRGSIREEALAYVRPNQHAAAEKDPMIVPFLPPWTRRTFLMLPTQHFPREYYLMVLVLLTTIIPAIFSIGFVLGREYNAIGMLGVFALWNIALTLCLLACYWLYTWYYAMRKKFSVWRRWRIRQKEQDRAERGDTDTSEEHTALLHEFGLDDRAITRNIGFVSFCAVPHLMAFYVESGYKLRITVPWIISALVIILTLFGVREFMRSESMHHHVPVVVGVLLLALLVIGIAGVAQIGLQAFCAFLAVAVLSQLFTIRHRRETAWADPREALEDIFHAVRKFEERLGVRIMEKEEREELARLSPRVRRRGSDPQDQPPRSTVSTGSQSGRPVVQMRRMMRDMSRKVSTTFETKIKLGIKEDREREGSIIPCKRFFAELFTFCRRGKGRSTQRELSAPPYHWAAPLRYLGDRGVDPAEKLIQSVSPRAVVWFFLVFLVSVICLFSFRNELKSTTWKYSWPGDGQNSTSRGIPRSRSQTSYPVCRMRWPNALNFDIVDFALLADLSYTSGASDSKSWSTRSAGSFSEFSQGAFESAFRRHFGHTDLHLIVADPSAAMPTNFEEYNGRLGIPRSDFNQEVSPDIHWLHFYSPRYRQHIILVRGILEAQHFIARDLDIWSDSIVTQIISSVVPFLRWLGEDALGRFVDGVSFLKGALDANQPTRLDPLLRYIDALSRNASTATGWRDMPFGPITVVGHGANGGLAKIIAARKGLQSVSFNPPGVSWLQEKMGFDLDSSKQVSVVPTKDVVGKIDAQSGGTQFVKCGRDSMTECHHMRPTLCEILAACGDRASRQTPDCSEFQG